MYACLDIHRTLTRSARINERKECQNNNVEKLLHLRCYSVHGIYLDMREREGLSYIAASGLAAQTKTPSHTNNQGSTSLFRTGDVTLILIFCIPIGRHDVRATVAVQEVVGEHILRGQFSFLCQVATLICWSLMCLRIKWPAVKFR